MKVPVVFASLVSDGLLCSLSLHRSSLQQLALRDATNSAECEITPFSPTTHTQRYTKLPLNAHIPMQPQNLQLGWTQRTSCSQGGFTVSTSHAAQTPSQCTSEMVCVRRRALLRISDLVLLNVYWVIWVAKHCGPDLKCNKIKLLIRESLAPLKINTNGVSLIPKNVSKPKVWIYLGVNLVRKHLVSFLSWAGICLGCLNERQVVFWDRGMQSKDK